MPYEPGGGTRKVSEEMVGFRTPKGKSRSCPIPPKDRPQQTVMPSSALQRQESGPLPSPPISDSHPKISVPIPVCQSQHIF